MPRYEFFCNACEQLFFKTLTPGEYEEGEIICPECGSDNVDQHPTDFYPQQTA